MIARLIDDHARDISLCQMLGVIDYATKHFLIVALIASTILAFINDDSMLIELLLDDQLLRSSCKHPQVAILQLNLMKRVLWQSFLENHVTHAESVIEIVLNLVILVESVLIFEYDVCVAPDTGLIAILSTAGRGNYLFLLGYGFVTKYLRPNQLRRVRAMFTLLNLLGILGRSSITTHGWCV